MIQDLSLNDKGFIEWYVALWHSELLQKIGRRWKGQSVAWSSWQHHQHVLLLVMGMKFSTGVVEHPSVSCRLPCCTWLSHGLHGHSLHFMTGEASLCCLSLFVGCNLHIAAHPSLSYDSVNWILLFIWLIFFTVKGFILGSLSLWKGKQGKLTLRKANVLLLFSLIVRVKPLK